MQLKHLLVALVVLFALVGTAAAADSVEIRSTVIDANVLTTQNMSYASLGAGSDAWGLNYASWAGFYYDLDDDLSTEKLAIKLNGTGKLDIKYQTVATAQSYAADFFNTPSSGSPPVETFAIIGFFAEPYVAIGKVGSVAAGSPATSANAGKLAKLVIDDDESYLLKTGATLELGEGYSIVADQIDVDGNKALLRFMKDGQEINASIVTTNGSNAGFWDLKATVLSERDVSTLRVRVNSVFQGTQDSLVEINGLWLIDYMNAMEIKDGDDFGKFEDVSLSGHVLEVEAKGVSFGVDLNTNLGNDIYLQTAKNFTAKKEFFIYKEYTAPGEYEIRSEVISYNAAILNKEFTYTNFAAFYYDLENGGYDEKLVLNSSATGLLKEGDGIIYTTTPKLVGYELNDSTGLAKWSTQNYSAIGLFGERYVALAKQGTTLSTTPAKMAKLVIDSDESYLLKTGATLELGEGYSIVADQIDVDGNKALLRFMKDGQEINASIVSTTADGGNWFLKSNVLNERDTETLRVYVKSVFQGTESSLVEISGLWLIDYMNAIEIKSGDMYGVLEANPSSTNVEFKLDSNITLSRDMDKLIANNMYLKTADNATLKNLYFYVLATVGEGSGTPTPQPPVDPDQPPVTPEQPPVDPPVDPGQPPADNEDKPSWISQNWKWLLIAIVLIIIIAGVAYYFLVMKKQ